MKALTPILALLALVLATAARAETTSCTAITSLPYTISSQGVYCLTGHLSTGMTSGSAITINANNVVLDLNGFKLGGLAAGPGTNAYGISAHQRQNITIRNGTIRGFIIGIVLSGSSPYTTSQGHVVEDIRADQNTYMGLYIVGTNNAVRNNQVVSIGGSSLENSDAFGIYVVGPGTQILHNSITDVAAKGNAIAYGIYLISVSNSVVENNLVGKISGTSSHGIYFTSSGTVNSSNNMVSNNALTGVQYGINFGATTGKYMGNITQGIATPYTGGTAAGTSNY